MMLLPGEVAANVGEQHQDAQRTADDRGRCESSYVKRMHSVLSIRSIHSLYAILDVFADEVCSESGDSWLLSIQP